MARQLLQQTVVEGAPVLTKKSAEKFDGFFSAHHDTRPPYTQWKR